MKLVITLRCYYTLKAAVGTVLYFLYLPCLCCIDLKFYYKFVKNI